MSENQVCCRLLGMGFPFRRIYVLDFVTVVYIPNNYNNIIFLHTFGMNNNNIRLYVPEMFFTQKL